MRFTTPLVLVLCLVAAAGCQQSKVHGPEGESVTLTTPRSLKVHRGSSVDLKVDIDRNGYSGPVTVTVSQLPSGVSADRPSATVDTTAATFVLVATPTATLVANQSVAVTLEAMSGRKAMQYISLDVVD
jgi:hypothetical protein